MSLKDIMGKLVSVRVATATPATLATLEVSKPKTVAKIATVAVATRQETSSRFKDCSQSSRCSRSQVAEYDEAAERIEEWLRVRPIPRKERGLWKHLVKATEVFAFGPWAIPAIESGWSDCALFSQALGLVPEQLRRALIIADIDASAATVMNGKGKLERFRRMNLDHPAWWNDPRFIPGEPAVEREWQSTRGTRPRKAEAKAPKKQSRETQCGACLFLDKGRCLWHEQPLDPTMALCGGVHHHDK